MLNQYDDKLTRKLFFSLVPIQILLVMCGGVNIIIDSAFASNLIGPDAMATTGLYGPLAKILDMINALVFGGAQILCGKYLGGNTVKRAKSIFTLDMLIILVVGLITTISFMFFPTYVAKICVSSQNPLSDDLAEYLRGISFGIIPFLLGTQLTSFLQLEKKEKLGYIGIGGMFAANTIADYLFIKVFGMGIFGLGLATAVSNWVPVIIAVVYYIGGKTVFSIDFSDLHMRDLKDIFKHGIPSASSQLMLAIRGILLNAIIIKYAGESGLAAFTAVGSFSYVYWAVPAGMSSALLTLASVYAGERDKKAIELLVRIYIKKAIPIVLLVSVVLSCLAYPLTNLFFHDPVSDVYKMTFTGFILFPLYSPMSTFIVGIRDLWRCLDHRKSALVIVLTDCLIFVLLFSFIMARIWGMTGIWIAQLAGCAMSVVTIFFQAWILDKHFPKTIEDYCCFDEGFGIDDEHRLSITIHSIEEVINISEKVIEFCYSYNMDKKVACRAGLCIEELAVNIVKHGFKGKKGEALDVSVTRLEPGLIITFKDNCPLFNPEEIVAIFDPGDPVKNIGIRLVRNECKQMEYHSLLGLNVLSISM